MTQRLVIALVAVFAFAAGFLARTWTDRDPELPTPPAPGSEFVRASTPVPVAADGKADRKGGHQDPFRDRAKLAADIAKVRPQIDAYRERVDAIAADFDRDLLTLLNPEQREKYNAQLKRNAERRAKGEARSAADTAPLTDEQLNMLQQRPLWYVLRSVAINWRFDSLNKDLKFDDAQQAKVRDLLKARREKFIALVDSTPPPSIMLSELARQAQKIGDAKAADK
jgi:hypothetical protein